jgi:anaerobic selenocysteine-containing dehydrogenase
MKSVKVFAFDVPRGNVMAYYPEANVLIATSHDPRSKTPAFKSVPVNIVRAVASAN